ncbi:MAG: class I SAM-dependent methyltransferase [Candidatus Shapirobacteria bacterium]|jgi:ubiquinone/menaquinone biosynthesis C-methylase UbiE|nr:class I SAM-dependent methyltransferase [Candidatus Shapirobacteria bacterium]
MENSSSWQKVSKWYNKTVGDEGHYYHQQIIMPNLRRILNLKENESLLDLACGQGILERNMNKKIEYVGIDLASALVREANNKKINQNHKFLIADVSKDLPINKTNFDAGAIVLALQNIKKPFGVIKNFSKHLKNGGRLLIILNHPAFRIPHHSSWGENGVGNNKIQYRRIDDYMTPQEIPILANPGKIKSEKTFSYHYPLSAYSEMLFDNGFLIEKIEEWVSNKKSTGSNAKVEDRARKEFPLFMAIIAIKSNSPIPNY